MVESPIPFPKDTGAGEDPNVPSGAPSTDKAHVHQKKQKEHRDWCEDFGAILDKNQKK